MVKLEYLKVLEELKSEDTNKYLLEGACGQLKASHEEKAS